MNKKVFPYFGEHVLAWRYHNQVGCVGGKGHTMNLHTLYDSRYFLQFLLEKGEISSTYQVWHNGWEVYISAKITESLPKDDPKYQELYKGSQQWVELGMHPNIVSAYLSREIEGNLWLLLEFSPGDNLSNTAKLRDRKITEILPVALEIANGMEYLHAEGVVHGNLTRENVLLCQDKRVRINNIRWESWDGLISLTKGLRSSFYPTINKLQRNYLKREACRRYNEQPPEFFLNPAYKPSAASDVYSFGVLLYELLTGASPLATTQEELENLFSMYTKTHQSHNVEPLEAKCPNLPQALLLLISSCLSVDPAARPKGFSSIKQTLGEIYANITQTPYIFEKLEENALLAMSLNNRALGHVENAEWEKAEKIWQEVSLLDRNRAVSYLNLNLLRLRRNQIRISEFLQKLNHYKHLDAKQVMLTAGKACLEQGSFVTKMSEELQKFSDQEETPAILQANFSYRLKAYQKARDIFRQFAQDKQKDQDFWYRLGAASLALKLTKETCQAWEFGLHQELPLWDLSVAYNMLLAMQGEWAKARRSLDKAVQNLNSYLHTAIPACTWSQVSRIKVSEHYGVVEVALSSDEHYILAWTQDGKSRMWEWPSGKDQPDVGLTPPLHSSATTGRISQNFIRAGVQGAAVTADGVLAATIHGDNVVRLWNMKKGECLYEFQGHETTVTAIAITPNGKSIISGSMDKTLRLWNINKKECIATLSGHEDTITCVAISEDGSIAVSGGWDRTVRVWDLLNQRCFAVLDDFQGDITALGVSADGRFAISGDTAPSVQIWDIPHQKRLAILHGHDQKITAVGIAPDAYLALSGSADGTLCIYEDISKQPCPCWLKAPYLLDGLPALMPLGERQYFTNEEKKIQNFFDNKQVLPAVHALQGLRKRSHFCCEEASKIIANAWEKQQLTPTKLQSSQIATLCIQETGIIGFVMTPSSFLFLVTSDGTFHRWDYRSGHLDIFWQKPDWEVTSLAHHDHDKQCFGFGGKDKLVHLWYPDTDEWCVLEGHTSEIQSLKFTSQGEYIISASQDGCLYIWDLCCHQLVNGWNAHETIITDIGIMPEERAAITSSVDGTIRGWEWPDGKSLLQNQQKCSPIVSLAVSSPKNKLIISGSMDGSIRVWGFGNKLCQNVIKAYTTPVTALYLAPNDELLVSGSQDGMIKFWDLATRKCLGSLAAHQGAVNQVALSSDGMFLFSCGKDKMIKMWTLDWEWHEKTDLS